MSLLTSLSIWQMAIRLRSIYSWLYDTLFLYNIFLHSFFELVFLEKQLHNNNYNPQQPAVRLLRWPLSRHAPRPSSIPYIPTKFETVSEYIILFSFLDNAVCWYSHHNVLLFFTAIPFRGSTSLCPAKGFARS